MPFLRFSARCIISLLFLAILAAPLGCGKREGADLTLSSDAIKGIEGSIKPTGQILATIGEEIITVDDYKKEIAMLPPDYRILASQNKTNMLEGLINKHLLLQEARRKNLQNSENVNRLFEKVKEEIIIQELIDREVGDKAELDDAEIEEYYNENKGRFMEPAKIKARHILVDSELLAKKILFDLKNGVSFEKLSKEYSLDMPTKDKGGDLGYFTKGTLLVEFEEICEELDIGEIGEVKTVLGYHIVKVLDKKEEELKTLEEVRNEVKSALLLDKELELYKNLLHQLRDGREITVNYQLLDNLDLSQTD